MSDTFGDLDDDDVWGVEPPDPEQVTFKLHGLRNELDVLAGGRGFPVWDDLDPGSQEMAMGIGGVIVKYILDHEPEDAAQLARTLHEARRYVATTPLPPWEDVSPDDQAVGIALMDVILGWLRRQGALDAA